VVPISLFSFSFPGSSAREQEIRSWPTWIQLAIVHGVTLFVSVPHEGTILITLPGMKLAFSMAVALPYDHASIDAGCVWRLRLFHAMLLTAFS
jgi:hypothetical protein